MKNVAIVGAGIAGLTLALYLQKHGVPATLYTDRSPDQIRQGRLPNTVARFEPTRDRERELGVEHWDFKDWGMFAMHLYLTGEQPLSFCGDLSQPASLVDMRVYQSTLLEDFAARGGNVRIGALQSSDVHALAAKHDLIVVATGRGGLSNMFPRLPEYSPYAHPQRWFTACLVHGIDLPEPMGLSYITALGHGEILHAPFYSFEGKITSLVFEGIPGRAFDGLLRARYDDNPKKFESILLDLLRNFAPPIYERVQSTAFEIPRPLDVTHGAITPTVRRGYVSLQNDKFAIALGDAHILTDPIIAQGANLASRTAWALGEFILEARSFDENFCQRVEAEQWDLACAPTLWSNAAFQPPPPHVIQLFIAAAQNQQIANALVNGFAYPERNWALFSNPIEVDALLQRSYYSRLIQSAPIA